MPASKITGVNEFIACGLVFFLNCLSNRRHQEPGHDALFHDVV